jgi:hypothetical protein
MSVLNILICDIHGEGDQREAVQHVIVQLPLMKGEWEGDVCQECYENFPMKQAIEQMGVKMRRGTRVIELPALQPAKVSVDVGSAARNNGGGVGSGTKAREGDARIARTNCAKCDQEVTGTTGYAAHWKSKHEGEGIFPGFGPYQCPDCKTRRPNRQGLIRHLLLDHDIPEEMRKPRHIKAIEQPVPV